MRREYENNILGFVEECDRRIRAAQKRLEKTPEENNRTTALVSIINILCGRLLLLAYAQAQFILVFSRCVKLEKFKLRTKAPWPRLKTWVSLHFRKLFPFHNQVHSHWRFFFRQLKGESGQVDQSMAELAKAEALKAEKLEKERELQQLTGE